MSHNPLDPTGAVDEDVPPSTPAEEADTTMLPEAINLGAPEEPMAVEDYGITGAEEAQREPLSQRLRRERPDVAAHHRLSDPARIAAAGYAGRLVADALRVGDTDPAYISPEEADADAIDLAAEEAAMHLVTEPRSSAPPPPAPRTERLELLEAQVAVLLAMARVHTEALRVLATALERLPVEEPGEAAKRLNRAAHEAHLLLTSFEDLPG